jgi:hypothetical protein
MSTSGYSGQRLKLALIGGALVMPSLLLVALGVLQSGFGINLIDHIPGELQEVFFHPAILLGGLVGVLLVCASNVIGLRWRGCTGCLTCTLYIKSRLLHVGLLLLSSVLLSAIGAYAFFENFRIVAR